MAGEAAAVINVVRVLVLASTIIAIHAQDISDFISIDCGGTITYADSTTGINYVPDTGYIDSGVSESISTQYQTTERQFQNVRSFPDGDRNCYTLKPHQVTGTQYLIRARFMYGNYDSLNSLPEFDLYIGGNFWTTVNVSNAGEINTVEIIHAPPSMTTYVCLVNKGKGTPFISVLELRLIANNIYKSASGSMTLSGRLDLGSKDEYRYEDDVYDRLWMTTKSWPDDYFISTAKTVTNKNSNFAQPSSVMQTALTPSDPTEPLAIGWTSADPTTKFYFYMHFAEIENLAADDVRQFNVYLNGEIYKENWSPILLSANTLYNPDPLTPVASYNFTLERTSLSTLPPILNAVELYYLTDMSQLETNPDDVKAIYNIKAAYKLDRIWQGDPCAPRDYIWEGLNCSFTSNKAPRIIALNLSSSKLDGEISSYISGLKLLQKLDLSNNNLKGTVPEFLSEMTSLTYINLNGNDLSGIVPADLVAKSKQGLTLSMDDNPNLCLSGPCHTPPPPPSGKKSILIPVVAAIIGVIILVVVVLVVICCTVKRKNTRGTAMANAKTSQETVVVITDEMPKSQALATEPVNGVIPAQNDRIKTKNQCFTALEISNMTNNLSKKIGEGGFGAVYLGSTGDVQVAVKILSPSSTQGYKEFKAEAELLMTVHHRNLTPLIGYCDESNMLALVYEFMPNGNLESHISDKNLEYLSWEDRLGIALDTAQGLEYLHCGCKHPIVHRDIKPANILLNENFEAKLADFGLSRANLADNHQTVVAGTLGYLDPEYYYPQQLSEKSDVFSFGVVLLEIVTSRPVMAADKIHIGKWVNDVLSTQGDIKVIIDRRLRGDYDPNSAWNVGEVALACVSQSSDKRPTMTQVVTELSQCLSMEKSRKNTGFTSDTIDSVEMASFGLINEYSPAAR